MIDSFSFVKRSSILNRLTLFYGLAVFVLLAVFALFLYWVTITILYKADYEFLSEEVDTIQYILANKSLDQRALKDAVITTPIKPSNSIYHYYIRVSDENGTILAETPGTQENIEANDYLSLALELITKKRYYWYSKNDNDYLLIQAPIKIGKFKKPGIIQIALDISYQHNVIRDRKKLASFMFGAILFSLLAGWLITRRGLRSLYLLSETVQKITSSSLDQRIDPTSWPKELRGLGGAFNQMLDRIEASFVRLKQFSADLSHELRTPITNLIGQTEVALSYPNNVNEYRQVLESNLEEMQRVSSLIENILFLARAENPKIDLKKIQLNVMNEIALVCEFYQAMADEKNITISYHGDAMIEANPDMFRRMISNILSNSLKYTPTGGSIEFVISENNNAALISLTDNGIGISAHDLPHIFDRFFRIDAARTQAGSGLGLSIVKSIVELHQGTISITSQPDVGTTISIKLPR